MPDDEKERDGGSAYLAETRWSAQVREEMQLTMEVDVMPCREHVDFTYAARIDIGMDMNSYGHETRSGSGISTWRSIIVTGEWVGIFPCTCRLVNS